eukprot:gene6712-10877_t
MRLKTQTVEFPKTWSELSEDILIIIRDPFKLKPKLGWTQLQLVYRISTGNCVNVPRKNTFEIPPIEENQPQPELLYYLLKELIIEFTNEVSSDLIKENGFMLLSKYIDCWDKYSIGIRVVHKIFHYLNENFIKNKSVSMFIATQNKMIVIQELGFQIWREKVYSLLSKKLLNAVLTEIKRERSGQVIEQKYTKSFLTSLIVLDSNKLDLYISDFENQFMEETKIFYENETKQINKPMLEYLTFIDCLYTDEMKRIIHYLSHNTEEKLNQLFIEVFINDHSDDFQICLKDWIDNLLFNNLKLYYKMISLSTVVSEKIQQKFEELIENEGRFEIQKIEKLDCTQFVSCIMRIYNKYTSFINQSFSHDLKFISSRTQGLKNFINDHGTQNSAQLSAELLGKYSHHILKPSTSTIDETEISNLIILYQLLKEQDVFHTFYRLLLSNRLIQNQYSMESETSMLNQLKLKCSYDKIYKIQRMFNDLYLSDNLKDQYKDDTIIDFKPLILTTGSWPLKYSISDFKVPQFIFDELKKFEKFYFGIHSGRKLNWLNYLSNGIVKTNYPLPLNRTYEIQVSTYQLAILLLFNDADTLKVNEIQKETNLSLTELSTSLSILCQSKILSITDQLNLKSEIKLNFDFKSANRKLLLFSNLQKKKLENSLASTYDQINEDRKYAIQAAIVRIMKNRKILSHNELISQTIQMIKSEFTPQITEIKKNLNSLIEKEYVKRDESDSSVYQYIA